MKIFLGYDDLKQVERENDGIKEILFKSGRKVYARISYPNKYNFFTYRFECGGLVWIKDSLEAAQETARNILQPLSI